MDSATFRDFWSGAGVATADIGWRTKLLGLEATSRVWVAHGTLESHSVPLNGTGMPRCTILRRACWKTDIRQKSMLEGVRARTSQLTGSQRWPRAKVSRRLATVATRLESADSQVVVARKADS